MIGLYLGLIVLLTHAHARTFRAYLSAERPLPKLYYGSRTGSILNAPSRTTFLPFAQPDTDETEIAEIADAVRSGWITTGPKTRQFEQEFAAFIGAKHAIAVNSCTAAMHLALEAIGIQAGDEVITTPLTFAASAEVIRYFNAKPVFVDVDPCTLNLDAAKVEAAITPQTRVILPVHLAGLAAEMDTLIDIARKYNLQLVEDAAHALPTRYKEQLIGATLPANQLPRPITCFSFYATKTLTTGEGGMICTDNDEWADRCRIMSLHGISRDAWKRYTADGTWYYEIIAPGYKYNLTDVASAMGLAQLRKVERMWARRRDIAQRYTEAFSTLPQLHTPPDAPRDGQHAWHLYLLRLNLDQLTLNRAEFIQALKNLNIGTSVHFIPLHLHPYYRETYGYLPNDLPVAYQEYQRLVSLPIYSRMTDQDVRDVIDAVTTLVAQNSC